jgi:hypothetical protein
LPSFAFSSLLYLFSPFVAFSRLSHFQVWVSNRITSETAWVDLGKYGNATDTRVRCLKFCDHVNPFSYAPEAGGYCA